MFYLKKVRLAVREESLLMGADLLAVQVKRAGILWESIAVKPDIRREERDGLEEEGTLWITDSGEMATALCQSGKAVLAVLHGKNRAEDFSACRYACEGLEEIDAEYLERVYRRYKRLPWDILTTDRCLIRETTVEDVEDFYRIYAEPSITEYMEPLFPEPDEERAYAEDYIDQVYAFYHFGIWTVVERASGEVIGRAGLCYREGYSDPELGFVIAVSHQQKGYATEVCRAILTYAGEELGFDTVLAFVQPENKVSLHLCEKLGMAVWEKVVLRGEEYLIFRRG